MKASRKWIIQRASALLMIPLMGWFVVSLISIYDKGYLEAMTFFSLEESKIRMPILIIISFMHIILGLNEVYEDYIQEEKAKYCKQIYKCFGYNYTDNNNNYFI